MAILESKSHFAIPPGETVKDILDVRGMTQKEFAARMDMSEKHISKLLNGEGLLTHETAMRLEMVIGMPAHFWERLEAGYRADILRVEAENAMAAEIEVAKRIPYAQMARLGWIASEKKWEERVRNLRKYFEVVDLNLLCRPQITCLACHQLQLSDRGDLVLIAWAQKAKLVVREQEKEQQQKLDVNGLMRALPVLLSMAAKPLAKSLELVRSTLAEKGVALVVLPSLTGLPAKGVAFACGKRAVIALPEQTLRRQDAWLIHVVLGHLRQPDGTTAEQEQAVEEWVHSQMAQAALEEV